MGGCGFITPKSVIQNTLKNVSGCCLLGTQYEVKFTKQNWIAYCQFILTGWGTLWAYKMLSSGETISFYQEQLFLPITFVLLQANIEENMHKVVLHNTCNKFFVIKF